MKINRKLLSMALSGSVLPWGIAIAQDSTPLTKPITSIGRIGDAPRSLGDTGTSNHRSAMTADQRPSVFKENLVNPDRSAQLAFELGTDMDDTYMVSPSSHGRLSHSDGEGNFGTGEEFTDFVPSGRSVSSTSEPVYYEDPSWTPSYHRQAEPRVSKGTTGWFSTEALFWWGPKLNSPALVATAPTGIIPNETLAGGNAGLGGDLLFGMRSELGIWLDDAQTVGVGGRVFGILNGDKTTNYAGDGSRGIGVPFFNATLGIPDVYLVDFDAGINGANTGFVDITNNQRFFATEAFGKVLLAKSGTARTDLIGGYTFARLDTQLGIATNLTDGIVNLIQDGTVITTDDRFATKNTFHGGHLGFATDVQRGKWTFSTLGKVALGNMHQVANVTGAYTETPPMGATLEADRGLFVQTSNAGQQTRNRFTFIPEANARLKYALTQNLSMNVGYTFLLLPDVSLAGGLVDPNIDIGNILFDPSAPLPRFESSSYYLHGLDLGLTLTF